MAVASIDDHRLARELADGAGRLLVRLRERLAGTDAGPGVVRAAGDLAAHQYLVDRLRDERPGDAILSEEQAVDERQDRARLGAARVWIIDPLDGTREYGESRDDWAVHVALVEDHVPTAGAVALPAQGITLDTLEPARIPDRPPVAPGDPLRIAVSRSRPPAVAAHLVSEPDTIEVPMGSAGVKVVAVVRGLADAYVHAGGQFQWDNCAPAAVALAAGAACTRLDGTPLRYNGAELEVPDLLVCRPELLGLLRDRLDGIEDDPADTGRRGAGVPPVGGG